MNISIREYNAGDRAVLIELFNEFGDFFVKIDQLHLITRASNYAETFLSEMLENASNTGKVYVAQHDNRVVGFIGGNIKELTTENTVENIPMKKGKILELFVTERYRGRGVGKMLIEKLEEYFFQQGCNTINVEVFAQNSGAYDFYSSHGYEDRNLDMMKVINDPVNK